MVCVCVPMCVCVCVCVALQDLNAAKIVAASSSYSYSSMDTIDQPLSDTNGANGALTHTNGSKSSNKVELEYYKRPFEFLSLGIMAYVGNDKALTQVRVCVSVCVCVCVTLCAWL